MIWPREVFISIAMRAGSTFGRTSPAQFAVSLDNWSCYLLPPIVVKLSTMHQQPIFIMLKLNETTCILGPMEGNRASLSDAQNAHGIGNLISYHCYVVVNISALINFSLKQWMLLINQKKIWCNLWTMVVRRLSCYRESWCLHHLPHSSCNQICFNNSHWTRRITRNNPTACMW